MLVHGLFPRTADHIGDDILISHAHARETPSSVTEGVELTLAPVSGAAMSQARAPAAPIQARARVSLPTPAPRLTAAGILARTVVPQPKPASLRETATVTARAIVPQSKSARRAAVPRKFRTEVGEASWYGPGFHGRRTAGGEFFDQNSLSAAHPTLSLNSVIRVTNLSNGRSVILRVTDRGPYWGGRILDVSKRAAKRLGFVQAGTTRVRIELIAEGEGGYRG
jgi:rare lipoprotein A (peptidoglycan hydrolase)